MGRCNSTRTCFQPLSGKSSVLNLSGILFFLCMSAVFVCEAGLCNFQASYRVLCIVEPIVNADKFHVHKISVFDYLPLAATTGTTESRNSRNMVCYRLSLVFAALLHLSGTRVTAGKQPEPQEPSLSLCPNTSYLRSVLSRVCLTGTSKPPVSSC